MDWFESDLEAEIQDRIYGYMLRDAYRDQDEPDLDFLNERMSEYDDFDDLWGQPADYRFRLRVSKTTETPSKSNKDLSLTKDLPSTYILKRPRELRNDTYCILELNDDSSDQIMGLPEAKVVGAIDFEKILETDSGVFE